MKSSTRKLISLLMLVLGVSILLRYEMSDGWMMATWALIGGGVTAFYADRRDSKRYMVARGFTVVVAGIAILYILTPERILGLSSSALGSYFGMKLYNRLARAAKWASLHMPPPK